MQRPDIEAIKESLRLHGCSSLTASLWEYIDHLESHEDGERIVDEADFDPETMEAICDYADSTGTVKLIVRNKVREEVKPRYKAVGGHVHDTWTGAPHSSFPSDEEAQAYADWRNGQER